LGRFAAGRSAETNGEAWLIASPLRDRLSGSLGWIVSGNLFAEVL
jgi:hypothetical protein